MMKKILLATALLSLGAIGACGNKEEPAKPNPTTVTPPKAGEVPTTPTTPTAATGSGTITGKISFEGAAPKMAPLPRQSDPVCAKTPMNNNAVVVAADGALQDVLVRLPVGAAKGTAPAVAAQVDQKDCMYHPYVQGVVAGQKVSIKNSDGTTHNIHSYVGDETKFNEAQPAGAANLEKDVEADAGDVIKLKCDVHAWMTGWVVVTDHPFFKTTGTDGSFKLEGVPAGTYELEAWHPSLGVKKASVTVEDGKTAEAKFAAFAPADYKP